MGGIDEPLALIRAALAAGKVVVTGNKALLAEHGQEIFALAAENKIPVFFEASTAGGIPIIKTIREALIANHIVSIHGIINGTSNYILTRMTDAGLDFAGALAEAQARGYAEADPTLDINGWDAAHKAVILASLAYGFWVGTDQIFVEGIEKLTATDIRFADELGYRIKLLAIIKADAAVPDDAGGSGGIEVRVHPTLIPKHHVLASVSGVFNAVRVCGDVVGETLFYGRGAGQDPTASAVISDLAEAAIALGGARRCYGFTPHGLYGNCRPLEEIQSRYYLRLAVDDRPGVLGPGGGHPRTARRGHFLRGPARDARRGGPRAVGPDARPRQPPADARRAGGPPPFALRDAPSRAAARGIVHGGLIPGGLVGGYLSSLAV